MFCRPASSVGGPTQQFYNLALAFRPVPSGDVQIIALRQRGLIESIPTKELS